MSAIEIHDDHYHDISCAKSLLNKKSQTVTFLHKFDISWQEIINIHAKRCVELVTNCCRVGHNKWEKQVRSTV